MWPKSYRVATLNYWLNPGHHNAMNLNHFGRDNTALRQLLQQTAHWRRLDTALKQQLPENLHNHFQAACIHESCLVILATNSMAASRLRMMLPTLVPKLQSIDSTIQTVHVRIQPLSVQKPSVKRAHLGEQARASLAQSADRLAHHPELAAAMRALSHKKN